MKIVLLIIAFSLFLVACESSDSTIPGPVERTPDEDTINPGDVSYSAEEIALVLLAIGEDQQPDALDGITILTDDEPVPLSSFTM